jgi:hypothetical protein
VLSNLLHKGLLDSNSSSPHISSRYVQIETTKNPTASSPHDDSDFTFVDLVPDGPQSTTPPLSPPVQPSAAAAQQNGKGKGEITVVTQGEMYAHVFVPHLGPLVNTKYAESITTEYIRSLNFHHMAVSPFLYELLINLLVTKSKVLILTPPSLF